MFELILISYLIGSIPFGLVLAKAFGYGDIRKIGSGNIGATNVLRTGNKKLTLLTLVADIAKGTIPVIIAQNHFSGVENAVEIAGFCALFGHIFPIWLGFNGGKGVATSLGILLAIDPFIAGLTAAIWLVIAILSQTSSLAALIAVIHAPVYALAAGHPDLGPFLWAIAALIWLTHRENIQRLLDGKESKIGETKKKAVVKPSAKAAVKKKPATKKSPAKKATAKKAPAKKKTSTAKKKTTKKKPTSKKK